MNELWDLGPQEVQGGPFPTLPVKPHSGREMRGWLELPEH